MLNVVLKVCSVTIHFIHEGTKYIYVMNQHMKLEISKALDRTYQYHL